MSGIFYYGWEKKTEISEIFLLYLKSFNVILPWLLKKKIKIVKLMKWNISKIV